MRLMPAIVCSAAACVLMGLSCPSTEPPLAPTLRSPAIDSMALAWYNVGDVFHQAVCLKWTPPAAESISIASYVVLRKRVGLDSQFSVNERAIPAETTTVRISVEDMISQAGIDSTFYCVYAVDSLGRSSDTSAVWTLKPSLPPQLEYPALSAQIDSPYFMWSVPPQSYAEGWFTYMAIVNEQGYFWHSPVPLTPDYLAVDGTARQYKASKPDSLPPGTYQWFVLVNDDYPAVNTFMGSMGMEEFHVP